MHCCHGTGARQLLSPPHRHRCYSLPGRLVIASIARGSGAAAPLNQNTRERSIDSCGYDAGKKIKGKKRQPPGNTQGLLLCVIVHAAHVQDRDGRVLLMSTLFGRFSFLLKLYADSDYEGL